MAKELYDLKGYEGLYSIDKLGNVYSLPKLIERPSGNNYYTKGKYLKPIKEKNGYLTVNLYKNKKQKKHKIHRLVAENFIENKNNYKTVDHLDFDKTNNNVNNLEWCSFLENYNRYIKTGRQKHVSGKKVLNLETGIFYDNISRAAFYNNIKRRTLSDRINNNISKFIFI